MWTAESQDLANVTVLTNPLHISIIVIMCHNLGSFIDDVTDNVYFMIPCLFTICTVLFNRCSGSCPSSFATGKQTLMHHHHSEHFYYGQGLYWVQTESFFYQDHSHLFSTTSEKSDRNTSLQWDAPLTGCYVRDYNMNPDDICLYIIALIVKKTVYHMIQIFWIVTVSWNN